MGALSITGLSPTDTGGVSRANQESVGSSDASVRFSAPERPCQQRPAPNARARLSARASPGQNRWNRGSLNSHAPPVSSRSSPIYLHQLQHHHFKMNSLQNQFGLPLTASSGWMTLTAPIVYANAGPAPPAPFGSPASSTTSGPEDDLAPGQSGFSLGSPEGAPVAELAPARD